MPGPDASVSRFRGFRERFDVRRVPRTTRRVPRRGKARLCRMGMGAWLRIGSARCSSSGGRRGRVLRLGHWRISLNRVSSTSANRRGGVTRGRRHGISTTRIDRLAFSRCLRGAIAVIDRGIPADPRWRPSSRPMLERRPAASFALVVGTRRGCDRRSLYVPKMSARAESGSPRHSG